MTDRTGARLWGMRLTFALLTCIILFFHLLPLETSPQRWVSPDLLLAFACAWSLRRPEFVPSWGLAGLFLIADLLLFRPPGLWAALALLGCEHLKSRARGLRDGSFAGEWLAVCIVMCVIALGYRAILVFTFLDPPVFGLSVFELIMTMLFYPLVAGVTHFLLGVRKATPGSMETGKGTP